MFVIICGLLVVKVIVALFLWAEDSDHEHRTFLTRADRSETVFGAKTIDSSSAPKNEGLVGRWITGAGLVWKFKGSTERPSEAEGVDDSFLSGDEARALIAMQLMQSGMDPSKEASWHAAAEDVVDLQIGDLGYELESQSEEIRMEDDESAYQASLAAQASEEAEAERFELDRRDETIRMD